MKHLTPLVPLYVNHGANTKTLFTHIRGTTDLTAIISEIKASDILISFVCPSGVNN